MRHYPEIIENGYYRALALAALAPQLEREAHTRALIKGLEAARDFEPFYDWDEALATIAPYLEGQLIGQALAVACSFKGKKSLVALAPLLSEELLSQGLTAALGIQSRQDRAEVLATLVPRLSGEAQAQAMLRGLAAAMEIENGYTRATALKRFIVMLPDQHPVMVDIRRSLLNTLRDSLMHGEREKVLEFCAEDKLLAPPVLDAATLAAIARHIIEVCQEWEWL